MWQTPRWLALVERLRNARRGLGVTVAVACLVLGVWTYDALGYRRAEQALARHTDEPAAALRAWECYQTWHPTRRLFGVVSADAEEERLHALRQAARRQEGTALLSELRHRAEASASDPEQVWRGFLQLRTDYPELCAAEDVEQLQTGLRARREEHVGRRAHAAHDALVQAEQQGVTLTALLTQADRFLLDFPGTDAAAAVRRRRAAFVRQLEERDIEPARAFSAQQPLEFQARRERFRAYLERHPNGVFVKEAEETLRTIAEQWDKHDFRAVRDHFTRKPADTAELVARCRAYLATHADGRFTASARDLLCWSERVTAPGEYRVVVRSCEIDKSLVRLLSRGPDLSVEIEVNGIRHGPSPVVKNRYDPDWNYEFPRRIRWQLGDPVRIRVTDHDWRDRVVVDFDSASDLLGMRLLSGEVWSGQTALTFESDFVMPVLPKIE